MLKGKIINRMRKNKMTHDRFLKWLNKIRDFLPNYNKRTPANKVLLNNKKYTISLGITINFRLSKAKETLDSLLTNMENKSLAIKIKNISKYLNSIKIRNKKIENIKDEAIDYDIDIPDYYTLLFISVSPVTFRLIRPSELGKTILMVKQNIIRSLKKDCIKSSDWNMLCKALLVIISNYSAYKISQATNLTQAGIGKIRNHKTNWNNLRLPTITQLNKFFDKIKLDKQILSQPVNFDVKPIPVSDSGNGKQKEGKKK